MNRIQKMIFKVVGHQPVDFVRNHSREKKVAFWCYTYMYLNWAAYRGSRVTSLLDKIWLVCIPKFKANFLFLWLKGFFIYNILEFIEKKPFKFWLEFLTQVIVSSLQLYRNNDKIDTSWIVKRQLTQKGWILYFKAFR